jgi:protein-S-isoprenylcysteine O-methyltransferase Ste14
MQEVYRYMIPALWLAWLLYWSIAAIGAKATVREESFASRLSHTVPLAVGVALLATLNVPMAWLAVRFAPPTVGWLWLGVVLVALGLAISVAARISLGANWSSMVTLKQDHELILTGPYRWVRHPTYTGLLLAVLGTAIALGEWRGVIALVLVAIAFMPSRSGSSPSISVRPMRATAARSRPWCRCPGERNLAGGAGSVV